MACLEVSVLGRPLRWRRCEPAWPRAAGCLRRRRPTINSAIDGRRSKEKTSRQRVHATRRTRNWKDFPPPSQNDVTRGILWRLVIGRYDRHQRRRKPIKWEETWAAAAGRRPQGRGDAGHHQLLLGFVSQLADAAGHLHGELEGILFCGKRKRNFDSFWRFPAQL